MYAVVTTVELPEGGTTEQGRAMLESEVIPNLKTAPGFVTAYFLAPTDSREGLSFVIFDNEESARQASDGMAPPPPVKLIHTEVREVVASA